MKTPIKVEVKVSKKEAPESKKMELKEKAMHAMTKGKKC